MTRFLIGALVGGLAVLFLHPQCPPPGRRMLASDYAGCRAQQVDLQAWLTSCKVVRR